MSFLGYEAFSEDLLDLSAEVAILSFENVEFFGVVSVVFDEDIHVALYFCHFWAFFSLIVLLFFLPIIYPLTHIYLSQ